VPPRFIYWPLSPTVDVLGPSGSGGRPGDSTPESRINAFIKQAGELPGPSPALLPREDIASVPTAT
jgi:hypothetical protein